ncbi:circadian associated repressor of transcription a [Hippoglossus stenolepis]|uniref:circadian associated repressor of transcription a n=1 Tax=Hippoglossus stenolepis TaxID=195615 RepID=UPI00159C4BE5|nr:circadian associated repressor of transcription a [Hippoglossus stenolepis]
MNSLGSSSKWPSYNPLPSTLTFVLSESEQTEDEADVFSEGEGDSGKGKSPSAGDGLTFSGGYLDFRPYPDQRCARSRREQSKRCADGSIHPNSASSPGAATLGSSSATPGDLAFAQKCADLHRFTRPLLGLLHGLKTGRFDKGLTSFQQSVAIDRLQRILGILQKPDMGEKYLQNLLQIEMMLKIWFPQLAFQTIVTPNPTITPRYPPHWRQNQLHMPVKKRKLSWSDPQIPTKHKHHHQHKEQWSFQTSTTLNTVTTRLPEPPKNLKSPEKETVVAVGCSCRAGHESTDSTGTLSRQSYSCSTRENDNRKQLKTSPPSHCGSPATQDNSVSSSDTITTNDSP